MRVTRAQAERRVHEAGVPVFLFETWAWMPALGIDALIPTLPRGRDADLGDVLAGVVVLARSGAESSLEAAWRAAGEPRFGMAELAPLLPIGEPRAGPYLDALATNLERAAKESLGLIPWMDPLATQAQTDARRVGQAGGVLTLPASDVARVLPGMGPAQVTLRCDGKALRVLMHVPKHNDPATRWEIDLQLSGLDRTDRWHIRVFPGGREIRTEPTPDAPDIEANHVICTQQSDARGTHVEIVFDRFALGGEPHAGRVFDCTLTWMAAAAQARRWPTGAKAGAIVIVK